MAGSLDIESKQSDYWFIEDTDEFLVCTVTAVSAEFPEGCYGDLVSIFPLIHKINRKTNATEYLFPPVTELSSISSQDSYVYSTVPDISADIVVNEVTKPLISYNEKTDIFNITFLGKYTDNNISIFTYNFQYLNGLMHLLGSHVIVPESKNTEEKYTFDEYFINKDYFINGNDTAGFTSPYGLEFQFFSGGHLPPNYMVRPYHENDNLVFSKARYTTAGSQTTELTGNDSLPIAYSGGYITQKTLTKPVNTSNPIRVEFSFKCYNLNDGTGNYDFLYPYLTGAWSQTDYDAPSASRFIAKSEQTLAASNYGEGFCVFFYEPESEILPVTVNVGRDQGINVGAAATSVTVNDQGDITGRLLEDPDDMELRLVGLGSSIGYCPASAGYLEGTDGSPQLFQTQGIRANGYLGICFDIGGEFCTKSDGKPEKFTGSVVDDATGDPLTIGVRGGKKQRYKSLFRSGNITASNNLIDLHQVVTSYSATTIKDIRIDMFNGTDVRIYGKLNSSNDWIDLYTFNLKTFYGENIPKYLKAGLAFTTSNRVSNFELVKFRVKGTATDAVSLPPTPRITSASTQNINTGYCSTRTGQFDTGIGTTSTGTGIGT